jgi:rhodanese-related sulfurtransferase
MCLIMPKQIGTDATKAMLESGAQLVEVLPAEAYRREHLPGAVSIPLAEIASALERLDPERPVIAYCYDHQCDLSARAAAHLEALGFGEAYDYVDSKLAWLGEGLPSEGLVSDDERVGALARCEVPRVPPGATVGDAVAAAGSEWEVVAVVNDEGVLVGSLRVERIAEPGLPVQSVMDTAPSTVRPSITHQELAKSMDSDGQRFLLVTTSAGRLIGLVRRDDLDDIAG